MFQPSGGHDGDKSVASHESQIQGQGSVKKADGFAAEATPVKAECSSSQANHEESERKARVDAVWKQMNKGVSMKTLNSMVKQSPTVNRSGLKTSSQISSASWMTFLGLAPKKTAAVDQGMPEKQLNSNAHGTSEEAKRLAAAALSAVKDAAALAAASARGKIEITQTRDFAGQEIEVKKLVDANSKEASEKAKSALGPPSAVDAVLEQIKKKQKLSVLDKTRKDWGEYKEENRGVEEELDAYKKSSNQYLDKVSFLQRTDFREFEHERDARLSLQAKRKVDMREDP